MLVCVAGGLVAFLDVTHRRATIDDVTRHGQPLTAAAATIYRAVSDANATATSGFLSGGVEPIGVRDRYLADVAEATDALSVAAQGSPTGRGADALSRLSAGLPVYTGLVETARVYNRQGFPLGAAYLREASTLAQEQLLPAAQELYQAEAARLGDDQRATAGFAWLPFGLLVVTVLALVAGQFSLYRRTNRVLNLGLVPATVAALVATTWLAFATASSARHSEAGYDDGTAQVDLLSEARTLALRARADESLTLVARGEGDEFDTRFNSTMDDLAGADGEPGMLDRAADRVDQPTTQAAVQDATDALRAWIATHVRLREADSGGRYDEAVAMAVGTAPDSTGVLSTSVDRSLSAAIGQANIRSADQAGHARTALGGVPVGVVVLMALSATGAAVGVHLRLSEYR